jgi:hypothetical protein
LLVGGVLTMPAEPTVEQRLASEAARTWARRMWKEARRIEESTDDPAARWELLVRQLARLGRIEQA